MTGKPGAPGGGKGGGISGTRKLILQEECEMKKYVYSFGGGKAEGNKGMKALLGGKGANLAEMTSIGIPVPPGFTISTEACAEFNELGGAWPEGLEAQVRDALAKLEEQAGKKFGDPSNPLLVSVRSGAAVSMPGMMDTVLNLGMNDQVREGVAKATGNPRFAWDAWRRFIAMFGNVVMGIPGERFDGLMIQRKREKGVESDTELDASDLEALCADFLSIYEKEVGKPFPMDPKEQLTLAINAVFNSWNNDRAIKYRQINHITGLLGTAVNVQAMVFGNLGEDSGTGVCFTRNPSTGENKFWGEFLNNAQGEDVVAGIRTPMPIERIDEFIPGIYEQLLKIKDILERHYKDMQDLEFTVERKKLYLLQTRNGKRTAAAAVRIATDMVKEGLIDEKDAVLQVDPNLLDQLLHPGFDPEERKKARVLATGLPASPGAAVGEIRFTAEDAEAAAKDGKKVILVRDETTPEDIGGMSVAQGILTARGGMTSHAAVVARGMGRPCVAGCSALRIDEEAKKCKIGEVELKEGDVISLDGAQGVVMLGSVPTVPPKLSGEFAQLMEWVDRFRRLQVRTNADTPEDAARAREFGAQGIGLCRTEHMFFQGDRILAVREMILAEDEEGRRKALAKLEPYQRGDFEGIFEAMEGLPVTIRLLDPPLHEFLPMEPEAQEEMAKVMGVSVETVRRKVDALKELNPMLGHRGCRLGISMPEIYEMQVRAIISAAITIQKKGKKVLPEIMIPLVGDVKEFSFLAALTRRVASEVMEKEGVQVEYLVGTMIEIPRAALTADKIASEAQFFSFGTNDLTQMTFGFSRDDVGSFLPTYYEKGILEVDPFAVLDQEGVGQLVKMGVEKGRSARPELKVGICGEHGGEPSSVAFCHKVGMNYVSCSPFRVPIARMAAAHAALKEE